ncbi:MAG: SIS domain-containing protein [Actinomycetota bacterium]|nr:SIS domain-containing protein [Actinomycetota bacterium]
MAGRKIDEVARSQADGVAEAAALLSTSLQAGGVVQAFGTGHSEAFAMEIAGRAGGLIPTNRLSLRDVILLGGMDREGLSNQFLERDPATGRRIYELAPVSPGDVFIIASNSGGNGSVVELAMVVKEKGHPLIAVTSMAHTLGVESRHASGKRLFELADVVLDNGAPFGDAVLPLPGGGAACGISSITAALLAQMLIAEVLRDLIDHGVTPPVYLSANVPGGDEHNRALEASYEGRLRRMI